MASNEALSISYKVQNASIVLVLPISCDWIVTDVYFHPDRPMRISSTNQAAPSAALSLLYTNGNESSSLLTVSSANGFPYLAMFITHPPKESKRVS
jgi:hypothetical protein